MFLVVGNVVIGEFLVVSFFWGIWGNVLIEENCFVYGYI